MVDLPSPAEPHQLAIATWLNATAVSEISEALPSRLSGCSRNMSRSGERGFPAAVPTVAVLTAPAGRDVLGSSALCAAGARWTHFNASVDSLVWRCCVRAAEGQTAAEMACGYGTSAAMKFAIGPAGAARSGTRDGEHDFHRQQGS